MSNKFKFILAFLENEKLNHSQKERFFKLVSKELEKTSELDTQVLEDLRLIKEKIGFTNGKVNIEKETNNDKKSSVEPNYNWAPKYICSSNTYQYFFNYNNSEVLKSTCHPIDSNELKTINIYCSTEQYDFGKHLAKINEAFEANDKRFAPGFVKNFVRLYITGKHYYGFSLGDKDELGRIRGWTNDDIVFSWADDKLKNWAENNKNLPPNPAEGLAIKNRNAGYEFIDSLKNSHGSTIKDFTNFTRHFKKLFHIKSSSALKTLLELQNERNNWNEEIDFIFDKDFPDNFELFTHVERLVEAYSELIELIKVLWKEKKEKKPNLIEKAKVKIIFWSNNEAIYLKIQHLNSIYKKNYIDIQKRLHGQTYRNLIKHQINGLCDLFVEADLGDCKFISVNIWDENYKEKKLAANKSINLMDLDKPVVGVSHIFKFKKA